MNTKQIKAVLAEMHGTKPSDWIRTRKLKTDDGVARTFVSGAAVITVMERDYHPLEFIVGTSLPPAPNKEIVKALRKEGKKIKHCGDYGYLFWNESEGAVWWTAGDADGGDEDGYTSFDEIERMFLAVPGVTRVSIEAEADPEVTDGWIKVTL